jgi:hypothetical protein
MCNQRLQCLVAYFDVHAAGAACSLRLLSATGAAKRVEWL